MDGTPIFDIKPYISYADCHPDARCGFVDKQPIKRLHVVFPDALAAQFTAQQLSVLHPQKVYGMPFEGLDIRFHVSQNDVLTVVEIVSLDER